MKITVTSRPGHAYLQEISADGFTVLADVSSNVGGNDMGLSPHEIFLGGLGACTAMTLQMVARKKQWDLQKVTVVVTEQLVDDPAVPGTKIPQITESISVEGNLTASQIQTLQNTASKCPVYKLLVGPKQVVTNVTHVVPPATTPGGNTGTPGAGTSTPPTP
jgi:uncharacterized OsmC-like protein